jgi:prolyl oligopeptidase
MTSTLSDSDPYAYLEDVESEASLHFARRANAKCLADLGDPTSSSTYSRVLQFLESDDRIPYAGKMGYDRNGEELFFNFWKDAKNPKGIWRKTTLQSYKTDQPQWETVLNLDELAEADQISWVWKGSRVLPRRRDSQSTDGKIVTRALLNLSRGGSDAVHLKEFDILTGSFVTDHPFHLPEAKTSASYKSRNVLLVGTDMGEGSLTDSGYPRQIRQWIRGTDIRDAPIIFEGETSDVSVGCYIDDNRHYGGPIYEIRYRSMTFYTSKYWVRPIEFQHLLAPHECGEIDEPAEFLAIDVQDDAKIDFLGNMLLITLRSDWTVSGQTFQQGSVIYCNANKFLQQGKESCDYTVLFEPTERTALEYYTATKNYVILVTMDNVQSKLDFYKIENQSSSLKYVGGDNQPQARAVSVSAVDSQDSDLFWFTTSGYTEPSTLNMADASRVENGDNYVLETVKGLPAQYDASSLEVMQHFATSKDGTKVPYFVVKKKGIQLNGKTPTLLYGYGGFEVSLGPNYIATVGIAWLERGGAYVEACIRGGGEFGPSWHQAALKANRNKAYEDFLAVGQDLCASGLCKPGTLAARGGSNGGLLMGNMYLKGKDLFGAIHCSVPLLDMKRFHLLLAGASWMAEYGNPDSEDWDNFLKEYSPYHNIDESVDRYPPMLVTTSTRDDRVHPAHARKMVAKLWELGENKNWPIYYYENIEGGHGGAADAKQSAFMTTLAFDFLMKTLKENASKDI